MNNQNDKKEILELIPGIIFILIILAFIIYTLQYNQEKEVWISYVFSSYGALLSGLGTVGILILAIYQIPEELKKFREQKEEQARLERVRLDTQAAIDRSKRLSEKIELVAAEVLEAVFKFRNAINHISNPFSYTGEGGTEDLIMKKKDADKFEKPQINADIFIKMFNSRLETTNVLSHQTATSF
jgi:hypothetical protein